MDSESPLLSFSGIIIVKNGFLNDAQAPFFTGSYLCNRIVLEILAAEDVLPRVAVILLIPAE